MIQMPNTRIDDNSGWGVTKDYKEAVRWFRLSAKQGLAGAKYSLGYLEEQLRREGKYSN